MKRSAFANKSKPKPTAPRNPTREKAVPPRPESPPTNPVRETKADGIGVRMEVMQGRLPPGCTIESRADGDWIVYDGSGPGGVAYVSMRVSLGSRRGRKS